MLKRNISGKVKPYATIPFARPIELSGAEQAIIKCIR